MRFFITGSAGFIGFHLSSLLLEKGYFVTGYDSLNNYYDPKIKNARLQKLSKYQRFHQIIDFLENKEALNKALIEFNPDVVIHLAAQAGVRYSIENPQAYIDSNLIGTSNLLLSLQELQIRHVLMASTSSVYGANKEMPFHEQQQSDHQLTLYASTKKANEVIAHSWSHIYDLPITLFRFFTVYGPWGRPDMALFKFTQGIIADKPIDVYNGGKMWRDFTYVKDLVTAISLLANCPPVMSKPVGDFDSLSPVAPFRIVNIGNSKQVYLIDFIKLIEKRLDKKAIINSMPMQQGDVPATWADTRLLESLTGFTPSMSIEDGVNKFIDWYLGYYRK